VKLFIAGARAITQFDDNVKNKLFSIYEKGFYVLVGDDIGADSSVQKFYADKDYRNVTLLVSANLFINKTEENTRSYIPT